MNSSYNSIYSLCIGVPSTKKDDLSKISCATTDAEKIYEAFSISLSDYFYYQRSVCFSHGCTKHCLSEMLSAYAISSKKNELFIFYFSGHGIIDNNKFSICCSDYDGEIYGSMNTYELSNILAKFRGDVVVILDCCYAGAALSMANNDDLYKTPNISVISSCLPYERSTYEESGSPFTENLYATLMRFYNEDIPISLVGISSELRRLCDTSPMINLAEGIEDIILRKSKLENQKDRLMIKIFLDKLYTSQLELREVLWYSLLKLPITYRERILQDYYNEIRSNPGQAHWLERRAIGTILGTLPESESKYYLINRLLDSSNWMHVCVGLIGSRFSLDQEQLISKIKTILLSDFPIDVIWLAHLYLSDSSDYDVNLASNSRLFTIPWGIVDVWNRYSRIYNPSAEECERFLQKISNPEASKVLSTHLSFFDEYEDIARSNGIKEVCESYLAKFMYNIPKRGTIIDVDTKWLFSALYGSWRDSMLSDLDDFIGNHRTNLLQQEFLIAQNFPLVEMRMSIFDYFNTHVEMLEKLSSDLSWGLKDKHPWARRTAFRAFGKIINSNEHRCNIHFDNMDKLFYPGIFDYIIEVKDHLKDESSLNFLQNQITPNESRALSLELGFELEI